MVTSVDSLVRGLGSIKPIISCETQAAHPAFAVDEVNLINGLGFKLDLFSVTFDVMPAYATSFV